MRIYIVFLSLFLSFQLFSQTPSTSEYSEFDFYSDKGFSTYISGIGYVNIPFLANLQAAKDTLGRIGYYDFARKFSSIGVWQSLSLYENQEDDATEVDPNKVIKFIAYHSYFPFDSKSRLEDFEEALDYFKENYIELKSPTFEFKESSSKSTETYFYVSSINDTTFVRFELEKVTNLDKREYEVHISKEYVVVKSSPKPNKKKKK